LRPVLPMLLMNL
jgi:hypothetical protein